ncbi:proline dehydrogenase family protein [Jiangella anatolica]|uniref:proline dehydrogenase n=1 Tax=Jiangella anatolica TaxID=2670374 RepID=A0A2W2C4P8_9ACTN|nr:proline dehydrogenase family protein [Jiangella anatolica]PZF83179.1 proline dehydrogenase [Jiangella anatolica]
MVRSALLGAARSDRLRHTVERLPLTRNAAARYVGGAEQSDVVRVAGELAGEGLAVTIDHLAEDVRDRARATAVAQAYVTLLEALHKAELTTDVEVSVQLSALGRALPADGPAIALENAQQICQAAADAGTTVTVDMEDHTTTDATLDVVRDLRADFPDVGAVLQAHLKRTEADCRDLAHAGSRVRLCKGAYDEPESVAYRDRGDVDRSYVRCMKVLFAGDGYPMIATHDPRLVEIAGSLAARHRREQGSYEYQMLYGIRGREQRRLVRAGERVRVYVPYGPEWYGYLVRRLAERPANLSLFLRSVASSK